jgi:hypothetical protein
MKVTAIKTVGMALALMAAAEAHDGNHGGLLFSAPMDGGQEVPAVTAAAKGLAGFKLNEAMDSMWIYAAVSDASGPITKFHIHNGKRGEAGTVAVDLGAKLTGNTVSTVWTGFTRADLTAMLRGAYYVNAHTAANPNGELRGQIQLERDRLYTADVMGWDEVPAVETNARGVAIVQLSPDDSLLSVKVGVQGIDTITLAHIHQGPAGANGSPVVNLFPALKGNMIDTVIRVSSLSAPAAFLDSLKKGSLYVNFHSKAHGTGEIRGQLRLDTERTLLAAIEGEHEVPAVESQGEGLGYFSLSPDDSTLTVRVVFDGLDSVTAAHIHTGATGANGGVLVNLTSMIAGNSIVGSVKVSSLANPGAFVDAFIRGGLYVNVHTKAHPTGEIRGQLLFRARGGYVFPLKGANEVPAVSSDAYGVGLASVDADHTNLRFMALAGGLYGSLKAAHFHKGAVGANGPAAFTITSAFSGALASGVWTARDSVPFTHDNAVDFFAGNLYMNVHSDYYPAGEIRGQAADAAAQAPAAVRRDAAGAALAQRALLTGDGRGMRIQGNPGSLVHVTLADAGGRSRAEFSLRLGGDGFSPVADLSGLAPGLYFAGWRDGASIARMPLLRR